MTLLTRDGHLHDLALSLALTDELSGEERDACHRHLAECDTCRTRAEAMAGLELPPLVLPKQGEGELAPVIPLFRRLGPVVGALLAAAGLLLFVSPVPEHYTSRGAALDLQVFMKDDAGVHRLYSGAEVAAGDRLGFRLRSLDDGYVLVFGQDATGATYPCWPQGEGAVAHSVRASNEAVALDAAVRLDEVPGAERIIAVRCRQPFGLSDLGEGLDREGCRRDDVLLKKVSAP